MGVTTMTLSKLIKALQKLEAAGMGRRPVKIDKRTLCDGNGVFDICAVNTAESEFVYECDGDGFIAQNADGSEKGRWSVLLKGSEPVR